MKYIQTDLAYYHQAQKELKKMQQFFEFLEIREIPQCNFYSYDDEAFEEYCNHPEIKRDKDFDSRQECWKCKFRKIEEVPSVNTQKREKQCC